MSDLTSRRSSTRIGLEIAGSLLLVLGAARYLLLFIHRGANLLDEGSQVAMANRILHGEVIYRDFLTVAAPGSFYTVAWLFQLFGTDLMVVRWFVFTLSLGILVATLIIARHVMSWPFAAASALLTVVWGWFLVAPNLYSLQAMFFALISLVCYLRYAGTLGTPGTNPGTSGTSGTFGTLGTFGTFGTFGTPGTFGTFGTLGTFGTFGTFGTSGTFGTLGTFGTPLYWLFLAGLACGAAILVKQNIGVYATIGLLASIWLSRLFDAGSPPAMLRERWYGTRYLFRGISLIVIPSLLYLVYIGAAPHLYENWFYYPTQMYPDGLRFEYPAFYPLSPKPGFASLREVLPDLLSERIDGGWEIWQKFVLYLPWVVYPLAAIALGVLFVRRWRSDAAETGREGHALLAVTSFGALTFLQAWPRADVTHILFGMQPAFVLLGYLSFTCWRLAGHALSRAFAHGTTKVVPYGNVALLAVMLLPQAELLRNGYKYTEFGFQNEYVPIRAERAGGVRTSVRNAAQIDQVTQYITTHTSPGDPIFVVPWAAGFYFLTDRPNPTRFDVLLYGDPDVYPCLIATLDERRPQYVIYGYGWDVDGKRFAEYAQPIDEYVRTRYQIAERFDEYEIWRRAETAEPVYRDTAGACRRRMFNGREFVRLLRQMFRAGQ